jgi:hypothetical protein
MIVLFFIKAHHHFFDIQNTYTMNNPKKTIAVINNFPEIVYEINPMLHQPNVDYILNASEYPKPLALLAVAFPDMVMLNIDLPLRSAITLMADDMAHNPDINRGMIISNSHVYYMSLCSTLNEEYMTGTGTNLELLPGIIEQQQKN